MMKKVLISTRSFGEFDSAPLERLKKAGFEIVLNPYGRSLRPEESIRLLRDAVGLIAGTEPLNEEVLGKATSLKVISRCGSGLDNVDLEAAKKFGIKVFNTPDAPTEAVAELTLCLILVLYRRIKEADKIIYAGKWERKIGHLLYGKRLGIIGLGRVGKRLVELTAPFKIEVLAYENRPDNEFVRNYNIRCLSLEEVLSQADIVSIHLPYSKEMHHFIGKEELTLMKHEAVLVNTSRGGLVDEEALKVTLEEGRIAGAALDVFEEEPYNGPLRNFDNVILTAHMGSSTKETRIQMEMEAVDNLLEGLRIEGWRLR
jgi:D-3-phosphoglycerate dehydrogenase